MTTLSIVLIVLLSISEGLAQDPAIKANSIFQLVVNILKTLTGKNDPNVLK